MIRRPVHSGDDRPRVALLDNHDSFTWNLVHSLEQVGAAVEVLASDAVTIDAILGSGRWCAALLGPGPGGPDQAGITVELVRAARGRLPMFGVCLGMQCIAAAFGGRIVRAPRVVHGKTSAIEHDGTGVFSGIANPMVATRYHSLAVAPEGLPAELVVHARADDATIMGLRHAHLPLEGVQFHPESILSVDGGALLRNWVRAIGRLAAVVDS